MCMDAIIILQYLCIKSYECKFSFSFAESWCSSLDTNMQYFFCQQTLNDYIYSHRAFQKLIQNKMFNKLVWAKVMSTV